MNSSGSGSGSGPVFGVPSLVLWGPLIRVL